MAIAVTTTAGGLTDVRVGDPLWWLNVLENRLLQRQATMKKWDDYYAGNHPLPFLTEAHRAKMQREFRQLLEESRSNFMRLVVDAVDERMVVDGFRLSAESDATADADAWSLWQANGMDAQAQTAILEALIKGVSYLSVWDDLDQDGYADIAVEDPRETIVAYVPGSNYRRRAAALKVWLDDATGRRRANVYLPDAIYRYSAPADLVQFVTATPEQQSQIPWALLEDGVVANPIGIVPIVPLRNRGRVLVEGESEIGDVYRIQNQINAFLFLLALAGYFGAHRQRWMTGQALFLDDAGNPREPFNTAVDKLWQAENPDVTFGEFAQTDLSGYIKAIEQKVLHIAVTTRTPRHYLIQEGQSPSGDAIQSAESGLVKKVERKQRDMGEGLEEAIRLARRFQGETDAPADSEIVWRDAQSHTPGVITDAVIKQWLARLIPMPMALERLGYSQTQIRQIVSMYETTQAQFAAVPPGAAPAASGEEFAPAASADPTVKSAQSSDVLRNLPKGS